MAAWSRVFFTEFSTKVWKISNWVMSLVYLWLEKCFHFFFQNTLSFTKTSWDFESSLICNSQNWLFCPFLKKNLAKQASYRAQNGGLVASCQIILWHVFLWIEEPTFKHSLLTWLLFTKSPTYLYNIKIQSFSNQIPFNFTSFGRS